MIAFQLVSADQAEGSVVSAAAIWCFNALGDLCISAIEQSPTGSTSCRRKRLHLLACLFVAWVQAAVTP